MIDVRTLKARAPKAMGSFDRSAPLEQTLTLIPALRKRFGITRIADTTYLDRTGMPTFSAIVPESPDMLSVYNGKGFTREAALASAVMEAVERQMAASPPPMQTFWMNLATVRERLDLRALDPKPEMLNADVPCTYATDILTGAAIPVPLAMVQCPWRGPSLFRVTSTNGLASGNSPTEALYHALCELIERHVWSMYHARSHLLPQLYLGSAAADLAFAKEVRFPTGDALVDGLHARVVDAGYTLRALYLEEAPLPATMVAAITEPGAQPPMAHIGFGTALSPTHALARAVTEAVQSRVVDIQAAREDLLRPDEPAAGMGTHGRRQTKLPLGRWYYDLPAQAIDLKCIPDTMTDDVACDLERVVRSLSAMGASTIAVVDLSPPDLPVHVVRVIIPEIETTMINGRIGPLMAQVFNPFAVRAQ